MLEALSWIYATNMRLDIGHMFVSFQMQQILVTIWDDI